MNTNTRRSALLRRFLTAATLAAGFGVLWAVLAVWLGTSILQARSGRAKAHREMLVVMADGTPLIQDYPLDNLSLMTYRELDGRPHDPVDRGEQVQAASLYGEHRPGAPRLRADWPGRIGVFMDDRDPTAAWYFVHDGTPQGSGYFVGYERHSNRLIGYIGLSSFSERPIQPDKRIPVRGGMLTGPPSWSSAPLWLQSGGAAYMPRPDRWDVPPRLVHVPSGNLLRMVDLSARTARTAFEAPEPIDSVGVPTITSYGGGKYTSERPILVRAGRKVYRLDHKYQLISTFTIPAEVDRHATLFWYEAESGRAIVQCERTPNSDEPLFNNVSRPRIHRIASDGSVQGSHDLMLENGSGNLSGSAQFTLMAVALPAPAALLVSESLMAAANPFQDYAKALAILLRLSWPGLVAVLALSIILAAFTWWRGRAFGFAQRERAAWVIFVLLLGLPAYVGFLLHRRWPAREACPHCHARAARDRAACMECGTLFPAPALSGTEIFA